MHLLLSLNCFSAGLILLRWIGLQDCFPLLPLLMWDRGGDLLSLGILILSFNFPICFPEVPKSQHSLSPLSLEQRPLQSSPLMDALWFQDSAALGSSQQESVQMALLCPGFLRETVDMGRRGR